MAYTEEELKKNELLRQERVAKQQREIREMVDQYREDKRIKFDSGEKIKISDKQNVQIQVIKEGTFPRTITQKGVSENMLRGIQGVIRIVHPNEEPM